MPAGYRVQLSRRHGATIGADAVPVVRPGRWGNPFVIGKATPPDWHPPFGGITVTEAAHAVALYRALIRESPAYVAEIRHILHGKRLACWCPIGAPCHGDVQVSVIAEVSPITIFRWDLSEEIRTWALPVPVRLPERRVLELMRAYRVRSDELDRWEATGARPAKR